MPEEPAIDGRFLLDEYARSRRTGAKIIFTATLILIIGILFQAVRFHEPRPLDYSKLGVHFLLDDGYKRWPTEIWPSHFEAAAQVASPGGFALQVISADDLEPERWQIFMDLCAQHNLIPIFRLATTYDPEQGFWQAPQLDEDGSYRIWAQEYAHFLNTVQWPTPQKHVILLNEPNNGREWGGRPDPQAYAHFVSDVVPILRQEVENIVIANAAFDLYAPNTGENPFPGTDLFFMDANSFMDDLYRINPNIFTLFDIWNSHAYPINFSAAPHEQAYQFDWMAEAQQDTSLIPPDDIKNRGINGYEWELWKLARFGIESLPVMISETGWRHAESTKEESHDTGDEYPDAQAAARYLDLALRGEHSSFSGGKVTPWMPLLADERVIAVIPFAFDGHPEIWGHSNWLRLDTQGQIVGSYPPYDLIRTYPFSQPGS